MITNKREMLLFYNPDLSSHRKTVAYAQSVCHFVKAYTFRDSHATDTNWCRILEALDIPPKELLNKADPYYQANLRGRDFDLIDWCHVLRKNPDLIKAPIAVRGDKAILCVNPKDILRLADHPEPIAE